VSVLIINYTTKQSSSFSSFSFAQAARLQLSPAVEKVGKESADCSTRLPTCDSNPKRQKLPSVRQLAVFYGFFIVRVPSYDAEVGVLCVYLASMLFFLLFITVWKYIAHCPENYREESKWRSPAA